MKKKLAALVAAGTLAASNASAALDVTGVTVDSASAETVAGIVITGLAAMWGIRKVIKLINRS